jgi:hypothetical protein
VLVQRIDYKNFDTKEINFGDEDHGTFWSSIYLFNNRVFCGIDDVATNNIGILSSLYKAIWINRNQDNLVESIDEYETRTNRILKHHIYKKNDNVIVANDGLSRGAVCAVLAEEDKKYIYYRDHQNYSKVPDEPVMIINFNNGDIIIDWYVFGPWRHSTRFYFDNGILMKREYINNRTETYTVNSGLGEIIITNTLGEVTERRMLERRISAAGYLEYEAVRLPSGEGYEYFFTKDTFSM